MVQKSNFCLGPSLETIGINATPGQTKDQVETEKECEKSNAVDTNIDLNLDEKSLEDLDDDELDSYIVSDDEFEQKKKAWLELYSAYLEEQKSEYNRFPSSYVLIMS